MSFIFIGSDTFTLLITYRSVKDSSGTLLSLIDNHTLSIFEIKINTNITIIYRYKENIEQLVFHHKTFVPNDGL
jgi:hypothetical protein